MSIIQSDPQLHPAESACKDPWLAVLLTKVFPGLGHICAGARTRGIWIVTVFAVLTVLVILSMIAILIADTAHVTRIYLLAVACVTLAACVAGIFIYFDAYKITKRLHPMPPQTVTIVGARKPWLAAFLSAIIPGIGQFYNGQVFKGLGIFGLVFVAALLESRATPLFIVSFLVATLAVKDAYDSAERINGSTGRFFNQSTMIVLLVLAMLGFASLPLSQVIKSNFVEAFKMPSGSMYPTLRIGDHFLIGKWRSFRDPPKRGDIIVFPFPENPSRKFVKRIVGIGGDKVQIISGELFINDAPLPARLIGPAQDGSLRLDGSGPPTVYEEQNGDVVYRVQYLREKSVVNAGPWLVPQDAVFVMGDNRDNSQDSRVWGPVPANTIFGKAIKIYWSWDREARKVRWDRIGEMLY